MRSGPIFSHAPVILGSAQEGGTVNASCSGGCGIVYKLSPGAP